MPDPPPTADLELMRRAIARARAGMRALHGGPFGALIVKDGLVVAGGENRVTSDRDPTAHAEIVAIRAACAAAGTHELRGYEIYSSCEPCPMCYAAIEWARLDRLWFAAGRADAAAAGFDDARLYAELEKPLAERSLRAAQVLREEAVPVFDEWVALEGRVPY